MMDVAALLFVSRLIFIDPFCWFLCAHWQCSIGVFEKLKREHPFKTSANFHDFFPLPPYRRQLFTTIRRQIWPIFDPFPPPP